LNAKYIFTTRWEKFLHIVPLKLIPLKDPMMGPSKRFYIHLHTKGSIFYIKGMKCLIEHFKVLY